MSDKDEIRKCEEYIAKLSYRNLELYDEKYRLKDEAGQLTAKLFDVCKELEDYKATLKEYADEHNWVFTRGQNWKDVWSVGLNGYEPAAAVIEKYNTKETK